MSKWDELSMAEKAEMMKVAVRNGITNLQEIRKKYNEFAEGKNIYSGDEEETQQMEVSRSPHIDLAISNPWLYQKLHPASKEKEVYEPSTFAGRVAQLAGVDELGQKYTDYTSSTIQQFPIVGTAIGAADLGYDLNRLYHNPSLTTTKDVTLDAASLVPALRKTMKGWWMKGNSGSFITETGQIINNPRVASALEVVLQPFRTAINTGVYGARVADFLDDSKAYLKEMYNSSKIGKHFPIKALGGSLVEAAMNEYKKGGSIHISPSKKGTFTAAAKKHGKSVQAFASQVLAHPENYSPAMRKKANFARNTKKWKHGLGGNLFSGEEEGSQQMITTGGAGYIPPVVSGPNAAQAGTLKDIAYRIMSQSSAENRGLGHIAKGVLESIAGQPYDQIYTGSFSGGNDDMEPDTTRDLNHLIVYGNTKGQYQPKELRGFDYSNYLQKNYGVNTMPTYEGRIVMANKVNIPTEYSPLVEWLSDRPKYGYYVDPDKDADVIQDWDNLPFLTVDDTASYRRSFRRDKSGKPELANQDLIDYGGKDYGRKYGTLAGLQGAVLNRIINSPVILDQGLPVNFTNNPKDFEQGEGWYNTLKSIVDRNHILQDNGNGNYSYPLVLPDINVFGRKRAEGGGIHIKPSHSGRLTELKERTGKSEAELYNDGNPAHKKMVVFARNSRKWKHGLGGSLVYNPDEENIYGFGDWLEKSYNKAKSVVRKGRKIVKDLGLDKGPIQHFAEAIGIDSSKESMKNSNQSKNNNLGFWTTSALDVARTFGINKKYKGKDTDTHYRQNLFNLVNPIDAVPSSVEDILYYKKIADAAMSDKNYQYVREGKSDATADAAWAKRLGLPYNNTLLIDNSDGSVHLSEQLENEIPIDTIFLKDRIANNERLLNNTYGKNRQVISRALDFDKRALNSLRHTYKTGEKVEMNEHSHNSRQWKQGDNVDYNVTPLSLLHRYTLQYDKDKNAMNYFDTYDFDEFEDFVPGSPFYIKGSINLNKRK